MGHDVTVAVLNSSEDTIEMLRTCLQQHGFSSVVGGHVHDLRTGRMDFLSFLDQHDPRVIVYDISIPYDDNWKFLQLLISSEQMRDRSVIVTTTNKAVLESMVGPTPALEIHGKPYDIETIVNAVERAVK